MNGATAEACRQKAQAFYALSRDVGYGARGARLLHLAARWQHLAETVERGSDHRRGGTDNAPAPARLHAAPSP